MKRANGRQFWLLEETSRRVEIKEQCVGREDLSYNHCKELLWKSTTPVENCRPLLPEMSAFYALPPQAKMEDYAAATPTAFPHTCSLCSNKCASIKAGKSSPATTVKLRGTFDSLSDSDVLAAVEIFGNIKSVLLLKSKRKASLVLLNETYYDCIL
ncbi:hypothetical protein XENOCAPTIV_030276 [Xenoophorus captivus]|uniref:RRM domain-containing protein n=1 Tax=Xenoophorus captivus TaxID=1517983 RepID=A0ABV0RT76_9TELE